MYSISPLGETLLPKSYAGSLKFGSGIVPTGYSVISCGSTPAVGIAAHQHKLIAARDLDGRSTHPCVICSSRSSVVSLIFANSRTVRPRGDVAAGGGAVQSRVETCRCDATADQIRCECRWHRSSAARRRKSDRTSRRLRFSHPAADASLTSDQAANRRHSADARGEDPIFCPARRPMSSSPDRNKARRPARTPFGNSDDPDTPAAGQ